MLIEKIPRYNRTLKKILKSHKLTQNVIDETEIIFLENHLNPILHYKNIICKKDKNRYSIRVVNTQYRILMSVLDDIAYFLAILNHKDYDKNNKDC